MIILLAFLLAAGTDNRVRLCDKADASKCAAVDATGKVSIGGTINASSSVHSTASAPSYTEGTDNPVSSDLGGATRVVCMGGTCGGSSPFSDNAAFTAGSTSVNVTAGVFDDSISVLTSGRAGAPRLTSKRAIHFNLRDNSGNEIPFPAALAASGGLKVDVQNTSIAVTGTFWQATQPVSGTIAVSNSFALDATLTGGTTKAIVRGGAKGATAAADVTSTANGADHQGLDVQVQGTVAVSGPLTDAQLRASAVPTTDAHTTAGVPLSSRLSDGAAFYDATKTGQLPAALDGSGFLKTHEQGTATVAGTVTANQGGTWTVQPGNTANTTAWKVDGSAVTQPVSGTFWQATQPVSGTVTANQGGAPWAENIQQINGTTILTDAGVTGAGSMRVTNATSDGNVLATANTGRLQVDVVSGGGSNASVGALQSTAPASATEAGFVAPNGILVPAKATPDGSLYVVIAPNAPVNIGTKTSLLTSPIGTAAILGSRRAPTGNESAQVVAVSPVPAPICPKNVAISQTASAIVIPGLAGKITYICKVFLDSTTAQSVSITEGTGTTCGTGALALAGHTTVASGMAIGATAGWVEGNGAGIVYTAQKVGDDICVLQSGAINLAGSISYVQFP